MNLSIVCYLDKSTTAKVRELQLALSEITGSRASLQSWEPHITIGDGITVNDDRIEQVEAQFRAIAKDTKAFDLTIAHFGGMDSRPIGINEVSTPYVIWIDVIQNQSLLDLVERVRAITDSQQKWYRMPDPYLPHVTLAFRDLSAEGYKKGLKFLKNKQFDATSTINHVSLVENSRITDTEFTKFHFEGGLS